MSLPRLGFAIMLTAFSGAAFCCGSAEAFGAEVCAHETTVRARMRANILCFINRISLINMNSLCGVRSATETVHSRTFWPAVKEDCALPRMETQKRSTVLRTM